MKLFSKLRLTGSHPISLVWKQPRCGVNFYELVDDPVGEALYATLAWPKWLSDLAVASSAVGIWHFDRYGWTRSTIMATLPTETADSSGKEGRPEVVRIANFEIGWLWEGDLALNNGKVFHWYRTKPFHNAWALTEVVPVEYPEPESAASRLVETDPSSKLERIKRKLNLFHLGRRSKPSRQERFVYEIEFGSRWFKQEAWITLATTQAVNDMELTFLLSAGMYLGYCFNQDAAAAVAVSSTAAVS